MASAHSLSSDLLGRILADAGPATWPAASRVCRRWRDVAFSEPLLWHTVTITPGSWTDDFAALFTHRKAALLERVGCLVAELAVADVDGWRLAEALLPLVGPQLTSLELEGGELAAGVAQGLAARFPRLQRLRLAGAEVAPGAASPLGALHSLRHLSLGLRGGLGAPLLYGVCRLAGLTLLRLSSLLVPLPPLGELTALRQLAELEVIDDGGGRWPDGVAPPPLELPPPAGFPAMRAFSLSARGRPLRVGGATVGQCLLALWEGHIPCLRVGALATPLGPLLAAALPPGAPPLAGLVIADSPALPAAAEGCAALASLQHLTLDGGGGADMGGFAGALAAQAPHLSGLTLAGCGLSGVPPAVAALRALRDLCLKDNPLASLPPGPYLDGLTRLDLSRSGLPGLPPALARATALRVLLLRGCAALDAAPGEAQAVLGALPHLREVAAEDCGALADDALSELHTLGRPAPPGGGHGGGHAAADSALAASSSDSESEGDGCPRYCFGGVPSWY